MYNKVVLVGHLGGAVELKELSSGSKVANVSLATSERWKNKQTGAQEEHTEWHNIVAFNRTAEVLAQYCGKGSKILVEGKIQTRSWDDKQTGEKKYRTEIVVNEMKMLDSKGEGQAQAKPQTAKQAPPPQPDFDDDIPF